MLAGIFGLFFEFSNPGFVLPGVVGAISLLLALFGQLSLVSPVANAIAIPLVSLMVVPLALTAAVLPFDAPLWLAHSALHLTMIPLQFLSNWPLWTQHAPHPWSIVAGMLGVAWMLTPRGFPARWLGGLMLLPMFLNSPELPEPGALRLIVFDVGQGLSAAVQTRHHALLYRHRTRFPGRVRQRQPHPDPEPAGHGNSLTGRINPEPRRHRSHRRHGFRFAGDAGRLDRLFTAGRYHSDCAFKGHFHPLTNSAPTALP